MCCVCHNNNLDCLSELTPLRATMSNYSRARVLRRGDDSVSRASLQRFPLANRIAELIESVQLHGAANASPRKWIIRIAKCAS